MSYRRLASVLGGLALGLGLIAVAAPGLVVFGPGAFFLWGVGGLILLQALRVARERWHGDLDEAVTSDPELPRRTPPPGEDLDAVLEPFLGAAEGRFHRGRLRGSLRSVALAVLTRYGTYSRAEAETALENGTWTDDAHAAAFLGTGTIPTRPVRTRIRDWFDREPPLDRSVRHSVDAIAAVAGLAPRPEPDPTDTVEPTGVAPSAPGRGLATADGGTADAEGREQGAGEEAQADVLVRGTHPTGHWRSVSVVALVGIGTGVLVGEPAVLLAGVVGIGFAAYARSSALAPGGVSIDRSLGTHDPEPGEDVEVTVTVRNETDRYLPDLRLVDGVPETLAVTDGWPRLGTALRPGERTVFRYTVEARRGVHTFGRAHLVARDLPGSTEQERSLRARTPTTLTCVPPLRALSEPVPLRRRATQQVGRTETPSGGDGTEFYATRQYRRGDPLSRIDWNRRARTGELTTVEFREEHAVTVVIVIDATEEAYVSAEPYGPHAVDRSVDAAGRLFASLTDAGNRVGITALSAEPCWLAPGAGPDHAAEVRQLLATHPALSPTPGSGRSTLLWRRQLRRRLPSGAQLVFLSSLTGEYSSEFARRFEAYGYPVTVLSPDPTVDRTPGHRLSRVARALRVSTLRGAGIPVVDWPHRETLEEVLARYDERWSG